LDKHSLEVLDFPRIREMLAEMCQTAMGREQALNLEPRGERKHVAAELDRLEAVASLPEEPPLFEVKDVRPLLGQLQADGVVTGPELLVIRQACAGIRRCRDFFRPHRDRLASIRPMVDGLTAFPELERHIDHAIDDAGDVRDSASPELKEIRVKLRRRRNALVERMERMAADNPDWYGGAVTVRGGRFVLPLLLEHRSRLPGVVHGSSGSGQTLFVEPLEAVADGNEMQELRDAEAEEVARILRTLSRLVSEHASRLSSAMDSAGALDSLVARRRFAVRYDCSRPEVSDDGRVEILRGRHPLLVKRRASVVPLDFRFPDGAAIVLISGPNAGGKTVVLKTLGLFSLMTAAGMFLPAAKGTRVPAFRAVFADIGDEQSLDSDLSSFTAHLGRLKQILDCADKESLVLVDEIGSSTAPEEGAALAVAVLEALRERGVKAVATTHFGTLKMFAQDEPGMVNAAMEFRGGPTFRLLMGVPGESSALEIAESVGLPAGVIDRAKSRMGREWLDLSAKLRSLDDELDKARTARRTAESAQREAERLRQDYDTKTRELRDFAAREKERLRFEEERFLKEKRREIENLVRRIKESGADRKSVVEAKSVVEKELGEVAAGPEPEPLPEPEGQERELSPGDAVRSRTFGRQGTVVEVSGEHVTVAFGQIKMELARRDLKLVEAGAAAGPTPEPVVEEPYRFEPRLNVRGMTRAEADEALSRFLDDAELAGSTELFILHGKGTGALRQALWARLRKDRRVEKVKLGEAAEGGGGVTLVTLKNKT
jgi:DNA mismatch repair protein MutS2